MQVRMTAQRGGAGELQEGDGRGRIGADIVARCVDRDIYLASQARRSVAFADRNGPASGFAGMSSP